MSAMTIGLRFKCHTADNIKHANIIESSHNRLMSCNTNCDTNLAIPCSDKRDIDEPIGRPYLAHYSDWSRCHRRGFGAFFIYKAEQRQKLQEKLENKSNLSIEYDEKSDHATYAPEEALWDINGKVWSTRKTLRVRIRNTGGGVARRCKGELQVVKDQAGRNPSEELKRLTWLDGSIEKDIGAINGNELLCVVFSDTILQTMSKKSDDAFALVATKDCLDRKAPVISAQHAFGIGSFKIELTITSEDGSSVKSLFKINVTTNFKDLSMEKL